jgi:hypothetical protein
MYVRKGLIRFVYLFYDPDYFEIQGILLTT